MRTLNNTEWGGGGGGGGSSPLSVCISLFSLFYYLQFPGCTCFIHMYYIAAGDCKRCALMT